MRRKTASAISLPVVRDLDDPARGGALDHSLLDSHHLNAFGAAGLRRAAIADAAGKLGHLVGQGIASLDREFFAGLLVHLLKVELGALLLGPGARIGAESEGDANLREDQRESNIPRGPLSNSSMTAVTSSMFPALRIFLLNADTRFTGPARKRRLSIM